jgi:hypothetical protein
LALRSGRITSELGVPRPRDELHLLKYRESCPQATAAMLEEQMPADGNQSVRACVEIVRRFIGIFSPQE